MEYHNWDDLVNEEPVLMSIAESPNQARGTFTMRVMEENRYVPKYSGSVDDLSNSFSINGIARSFAMQGMEVQFVFNPQDLKEIPEDLIPRGTKLN